MIKGSKSMPTTLKTVKINNKIINIKNHPHLIHVLTTSLSQ